MLNAWPTMPTMRTGSEVGVLINASKEPLEISELSAP